MDLREHEFEPSPGLPELLPAGERILWRGAPDWRVLARRAFLLHWLALYFAALLAWRLAEGAPQGETLVLAALAVAVLGGGTLFAWAVGRTTLYTLTNRRLVLRIGVALPVTINLPFAAIADAGLRLHPDGTGDIGFGLVPAQKIAFAMFWPHVRPWRLGRAEPMLRCIPDAAGVAALVAESLAASAGQPVARPVSAPPAVVHATPAVA